MMKYSLLVLCYCILRVQGTDLEFTGCNTNGWSCQTANSGFGIDVVFNCPKEFEEQNSNITWRYNGLPSATESVTIQNCDNELTLEDANLSSYKATKSVKTGKAPKQMTDFLINFRSIVIRNVKELKLDSNFKNLISRLRGNASVLFEDVGLIKVLPSHLIKGPSPDVKRNKMESFNFTMRRVKIQHADDRAVLWNKENITLLMEWENVNVESANSTVEIIATKTNNQWPNSEIEELEHENNHEVYIRNCTFKTMNYRTFILNTTVFQFTDNYVDTFTFCGFDIDSLKTTISRNTFNRINGLAFGYVDIGLDKNNVQFESNIINKSEKKSLYFQEVHQNLDLLPRISIRGNKFQCHNADWLHKSKDEADIFAPSDPYRHFLKNAEDLSYMDSDNICVEIQCMKVTVKDYREFYLKNGKAPEKCGTVLI